MRVTAENPAAYGFVATWSTKESNGGDADEQWFSRRSIQRVTDALGHATTSESDALGREARTTYADGTYTETLYGVSGQAVNRSDVSLPSAAEGWAGVPSGGRHVVKIEQRRIATPAEPVIATHELYDAAGRLTDVWQPAVLDADPASPTYNQSVRPHWHYAYDANGNQASQVDPKNHATTFAYDEKNRRTRRTLPLAAGEGTARYETWTYDAFGRQSVHADFMSRETKWVYSDAAADGGRLIEEQRFTGAVGGTPNEKTAYTYDDLGRTHDVKEYTGGTLSRTTTYAYDAITGGMTQVDSPEAPCSSGGRWRSRRRRGTGCCSRAPCACRSPCTSVRRPGAAPRTRGSSAAGARGRPGRRTAAAA